MHVIILTGAPWATDRTRGQFLRVRQRRQEADRSQAAGRPRINSIKYDSSVHARKIESTLGSLEKKATVYYVRAPRYLVAVLGLMLLLPWAVVLALWWRSRPSRTASGPGEAVAVSGKADRHYCKPGPWGKLEYFDIVTRPPDEFISPSFFTAAPTQWVFKGYSKAALVELLASAGLTLEQRAAIDGSTEFSPAANQCVVKPSNELVRGLSPASRARIYGALAKFPENSVQRDPFIFRPQQIHEWLDGGGLAQPTVALVKKLLYPHGDLVLLADCGTIMRQLPDPEEHVRLLKILFRRRAVYPLLRVTADSDLEALVSYWGKGGRAVAVAPLLQSLPRTASGIGVNLVLLLPAFARERLYTYPLPSSRPQAGVERDCHWSALNFFNNPPDERFARPEAVHAAIENEHFPVPGSPSFGDLVLFSAPGVGIIHSAVYVADDILFTKGGPSFTSPWLLMTQDEVLACFPAYEKLNVGYHRLKKL